MLLPDKKLCAQVVQMLAPRLRTVPRFIWNIGFDRADLVDRSS